jgi:Protein of unknown function (DUF2892)
MAMNKNVPNRERVIRVVLGLAAAAVGGVLMTSSLLWGAIVLVSGIGFGATGVIGWCPMCAMVGRTLPKAERTIPIGKL